MKPFFSFPLSVLMLLPLFVFLTGCGGNNDLVDVRDRYLGNYRVFEECNGSLPSEDEYTLVLARGAADDRIEIRNLYNQGLTGYIDVNEQGDLAFDNIGLGSFPSGRYTCSLSAQNGRGQLTGDELTLTFKVALSRLAANPPQCPEPQINCIVTAYR